MINKKVLVAMPDTMLTEIDRIAQIEHRTRSDLIREAMRRYSQNFQASAVAKLERSLNRPTANNHPESAQFTE